MFHFIVDDLSYHKLATQLPNTGSTTGADDAVDRNGITCMKTADIGLTSEYKTVWWKVDLGGVYNIHSINILFKNYDGQGMYYYKQQCAGLLHLCQGGVCIRILLL